jgi:hypothetical protein
MKGAAIFKIVRRSLEAGQAVEIEGLWRFRASPNGYRFDPETQPTVFVAPERGAAALRRVERGGVFTMAR